MDYYHIFYFNYNIGVETDLGTILFSYWDNVSINEHWLNKLDKSNNKQESLNLDTLDTSKNTISKHANSIYYRETSDIIKNKASKTTNDDLDTLDTLQENPFKDLKLEDSKDE